MNEAEFLLWVRGPGLALAAAIFVGGLILRLFEIYSLGRATDLAPPRSKTPGSPWRTLLTRSVPAEGMLRRGPMVYIGGYIFHIGLFVTFFLFVPHIEFVQSVIGLSWPGLASPAVDLVAVITLITLLLVLLARLTNSVQRYLSDAGDWWAWLVTFLPVLTGWMAYHHLLFSYTTMLALHILMVELLLVSLPFGKLSHFITLWISRWYNGERFARKGVAS